MRPSEASRTNRGLMAVLLGGALLAAGLVVAVGVTGFGERDRLPAGVIATVDGIEVTAVEWEAALQLVALAPEHLRIQLENLPESMEDVPGMRPFMEASLELIGEYPVELRALASIIGAQAIFAEVKRRGFPLPDEAAVQAEVDIQRVMTMRLLAGEFGDEGGGTEHLRALLDYFGVDRYFDEYMPAVMLRSLAVRPLYEEVVREPQTWEEFSWELTRKSRLVLGQELREQFSEDDVWELLERSAAIPLPGSR